MLDLYPLCSLSDITSIYQTERLVINLSEAQYRTHRRNNKSHENTTTKDKSNIFSRLLYLYLDGIMKHKILNQV